MTEGGLPYTVQQSGTVPIVTHVPAFAWRCGPCGWLGVGLTSERAAQAEAANHTWEEHGVAGCIPGDHDSPHIWEHVTGTDSIDRCPRCGWEIGK